MAHYKILVFEYITGGGLSNQPLPISLMREGSLMLEALLRDLTEIMDVDLLVMLDERFNISIINSRINLYKLSAQSDWLTDFTDLAEDCDAVWPIAPETEGILEKLCQTVAHLGKTLLTSPANAVLSAGNKWLSYQILQRHGLPVVFTQLLSEYDSQPGEWIVKPVDGVGGEDSYICTDPSELENFADHSDTDRYIIQPHLSGFKTSLSCVFKNGQGWIICYNKQHFTIINRQYRLHSLIVNACPALLFHHDLVDRIGKAFPELWGYVGIDLIETETGSYILEINPRLTTTYAGIRQACKVNVSRLVLNLLKNEIPITHKHPQSIPVTIAVN